MKSIDIDIETYSEASLPDVGVYRYAADPSFEILLLSYAVDGGEVVCLDLTQQELPQWLIDALQDESVLKIAHNAQFERVCLSEYIGFDGYLPPEQWYCTMVHAMELGLPASLGQLAKALQLDVQKDTAGKGLIRYFSTPCKPTKVNGGRTRNLPEHDPEKWEKYKAYNSQDVVVEMDIYHRLLKAPVEQSEWELWYLDQRINDRGVKLDLQLVSNAIRITEQENARHLEKMVELTGLENPNSVAQLKDWLASHGVQVDSLAKAKVDGLLGDPNTKPLVKEVLTLRQLTSNSSVKKYDKMKEIAHPTDERARGVLQFSGASTTQRWAGRLIQVQNLPRNYMSDLDTVRDMVKDGDDLSLVFEDVSDVLKQLLRTALVPDKKYFVISDYSAIEARVLAWFAGEDWVLDVFRGHGKIYEATAAQMYNIPIEQVDSEMRQKGKVATLALGYQGSAGALKAMGALKMGIKEHELQGIVDSWREANSNIKQFWYDLQDAVMTCIRTRQPQRVGDKLKIYRKSGFLFIELPSGRALSYPKPHITQGKFGDVPAYMGERLTVIDTYGGKLVENVVQATARDILANGLLKVSEAGLDIVFHVHDEVVIESDRENVYQLNALLADNPDWCKDLPLGAEGFSAKYYQKD